jgi:putative zinc finger/helix-turn-helix YgiT family protein
MTQQVSAITTKCPECGKGQLIAQTRTEEFDFDLDGETIKVRAENVPVEKCDECGEVMSGPAAAKVRHEAICRAAGLLTPAEIKALRDQFGWSQQYLADLTDFGVATISRWERGRLLQNRSNNKILQAIRDCPPFREYLEGLLGPKTRKQEPGPGEHSSVPGMVQSKPLPSEARLAAVEARLEQIEAVLRQGRGED